MAIEIPESATFYIRTGLNRGLEKMQTDMENIKKAIGHPDLFEAIKESLEGVLAHNRQWYKEAVAEYKELPESIRPDKDLLDYEV